jgi:hypothetical protein
LEEGVASRPNLNFGAIRGASDAAGGSKSVYVACCDSGAQLFGPALAPPSVPIQEFSGKSKFPFRDRALDAVSVYVQCIAAV